MAIKLVMSVVCRREVPLVKETQAPAINMQLHAQSNASEKYMAKTGKCPFNYVVTNVATPAV